MGTQLKANSFDLKRVCPRPTANPLRFCAQPLKLSAGMPLPRMVCVAPRAGMRSEGEAAEPRHRRGTRSRLLASHISALRFQEDRRRGSGWTRHTRAGAGRVPQAPGWIQEGTRKPSPALPGEGRLLVPLAGAGMPGSQLMSPGGCSGGCR